MDDNNSEEYRSNRFIEFVSLLFVVIVLVFLFVKILFF
jgi:hypothetical protein